LPFSDTYARRLLPVLADVVATYGTPFHIYDERGIQETHTSVVSAFGSTPFRQYFAVKALPNPTVLALLLAEGSGLDCSSPAELLLADRLSATGDQVVFTSNNTTLAEYHLALRSDALVTFDDRSFFGKVDALPETVTFRVSPHGLSAGSFLMGDATASKFGVPAAELVAAYREARHRGARSFGIHGMVIANELRTQRAIQAAVDVMELGAHVAATVGIELDYVNVGGGLGIPYRPADTPIDFPAYARALADARDRCFPTRPPRIITEFGRYITGPHGVLVTRVINRSRKGRNVVGLDASMSALMRPGFYRGAYHHLSLPFAGQRPLNRFDVVGSMCENIDKFAIGRLLPEPAEGDIVIIHDTGAHGHAMGFTYNGRLRPAELLLTSSGDVVEIRRAETFEDFIATARWQPRTVLAGADACVPAAAGESGRS
jgi:diaminopimelate decarboxylase/decarboxylase